MKISRKDRFLAKYQRFSDLCFLSLLFMVTSLPVVTIGASVAALYTATAKIFLHDEGTIRSTYMDAWKANLKQGTVLTCLTLAAIALAVYNIVAANRLVEAGSALRIFAIAAWLFVIPLGITMPWVFVYLSRFNDSTVRIIKNSFLLGMTNFPVTLYMLGTFVLCVALLLVLLPVFPFALGPLFLKVVEKSEPVLIKLSQKSEGYDPDAWYNRKVDA